MPQEPIVEAMETCQRMLAAYARSEHDKGNHTQEEAIYKHIEENRRILIRYLGQESDYEYDCVIHGKTGGVECPRC